MWGALIRFRPANRQVASDRPEFWHSTRRYLSVHSIAAILQERNNAINEEVLELTAA